MTRSRALKVLAVCIALPFATATIAQDLDSDLEALKAPSMPAATIIGTQINEVNRVRSMKALETALLNNFADADVGLKIPDNYAVEFQPFLLGRLKNYNYKEYLGDDQSLCESIWRNLAISVASTKNYPIKDSATDAIGFGVRTVLLQGELSAAVRTGFKAAVASLELGDGIKAGVKGSIDNTLLNDPAATLAQVKAAALTDLAQLSAVAALDTAARKSVVDAAVGLLDEFPDGMANTEYVEAYADLYDERIQSHLLADLKKAIDEVGTERYGLSIEFDGAAALNFPTNEIGYTYGPRYGAWLNIAYRLKKGEEGEEVARASEFILLARAINHNSDFYRRFDPPDTTFDRGLNVDLGLKYVLNKDRWSVELEWIQRFNRARETRLIDDVEYYRNVDNASSKFMLNLNYTVAKNVNISYNIGKDFDDVFDTGGNLISLLNLNVSFGGLDAKKVVGEK
ncbi:MAG: hypothetical protein ABI599_02175 [Flavobacteriales bacterium]